MIKRIAIFFALLFTGTSNCIPGSSAIAISAGDSLRIVIPFNNCSGDPLLGTGPDFSAWIDYGNRIILFDTGSDYLVLLENFFYSNVPGG